MILKSAFAAFAAVAFCSPAVSGESESYKVIVLEKIYHEITLDAADENGAKTLALSEAERTAGAKRYLESPAISSHALQNTDFSVIVIKSNPETTAADLQSRP